MTSENETKPNTSPVCENCSSKYAEKVLAGIRAGAFDLGEIKGLTDEQLMGILLAGAAMLAARADPDPHIRNAIFYQGVVRAQLDQMP